MLQEAQGVHSDVLFFQGINDLGFKYSLAIPAVCCFQLCNHFPGNISASGVVLQAARLSVINAVGS